MRRFAANLRVQIHACAALRHLGNGNAANRVRVENAGARTAVAAAMLMHAGSTELRDQALMITSLFES